jgi:hypothetical protein
MLRGFVFDMLRDCELVRRELRIVPSSSSSADF